MRLAALLAAALASPAFADDARVLEACVSRVSDAQAMTGERLFDPSACIGSVEFLCAELGEEDCLAREEDAWRVLAERALETLSEAAVDPETAEALGAAQSDWEAWMARDCALAAPFAEPGLLAGLPESVCHRDSWAERAIRLRARAGTVF